VDSWSGDSVRADQMHGNERDGDLYWRASTGETFPFAWVNRFPLFKPTMRFGRSADRARRIREAAGDCPLTYAAAHPIALSSSLRPKCFSSALTKSSPTLGMICARRLSAASATLCTRRWCSRMN
jgi:hypothetical protein